MKCYKCMLDQLRKRLFPSLLIKYSLIAVSAWKIISKDTIFSCGYKPDIFLFSLQEAKKLIAFTFGVVSHQVADITWHSLGIDQGFLQTMGKVNFHGLFSAAHPVGDVGGDMVSMFEGDLQEVFRSETWYGTAKF